MFATYEVLEKAVASGKNLIICHEPVFYTHLDHTSELEKANDKVFEDKKKYIDEHGLVIWRFHDHWHMRRPDGIMSGMVHALAWEKFENPKSEGDFVIPSTTVEELAKYLRDELDIQTLRYIGDPMLKVSKICLMPGAPGSDPQIKALRRNDVDVLLIGESPEWETASYVRDAAAQGKPKALIVLGHVPSEESGMIECANWLKTFIKDIPIEFIAAGETYKKLR
jgi:putative NIF3 family GTP cyclohydrolase 1 type 2